MLPWCSRRDWDAVSSQVLRSSTLQTDAQQTVSESSKGHYST